MKVDLEKVKTFTNDLSEEAYKSFSAGNLLSVDCEMMGLNPYRDRLCLVQMCGEDNSIVLVKFENKDLKGLAPNLKALFENDKVTKIFHFARTDLTFLKLYLDIEVKNVFCTKNASRLTRTFTDKHSLKDIVKDLFNINLDKASQSSDWGQDDLTRDQIKYAASDVIYLIPIYKKLSEVLKREGRIDLLNDANKFLPTLAKLDLMGYTDFFAH